jgi:cysteine desulfurase
VSIGARIYLDFNATAPLLPAARAAMVAALDEHGGNPSSVHREGRRARHVVETARDRVAARLGVGRDQIVFTSGGSESNAIAIAGLARLAGAGAVVAAPMIEHPSVRGAVERCGGGTLPIDLAGRLYPSKNEPMLGVVAVAAVNHEIGVMQDPATAALWTRDNGTYLHVDAVQAFGKRDLAPWLAIADTLAISAHKIGGPPGTGALWIRPGLDLPQVLAGGHQERGRRAGTENVVGIAGFGAAADEADPATWPAVAALGAAFERGLVALGGEVHGSEAPRVGGTINVRFPGCVGQSVVIALDLAGIAASTGAACTSGTVAPSPVLLALGISDDRAIEAVRFSLGRSTTMAEIEQVLHVLPAILDRARQ